MAERTSLESLEALKQFDTPTITNVVATYPSDPLCLGLYNPWTENWYTDQTIKCIYPELGRTVGYAVTCVFGLPEPGFDNLSFVDVINALDESPRPTILVIQQKFPPSIAGKVGLAGGKAVLKNATALQAAEEKRINAFQRARTADDIRAILSGHSYGDKE